VEEKVPVKSKQKVLDQKILKFKTKARIIMNAFAIAEPQSFVYSKVFVITYIHQSVISPTTICNNKAFLPIGRQATDTFS